MEADFIFKVYSHAVERGNNNKNSNETDPDSNEMDLGMLDAEITQLLFRLMRLVIQWPFCIKIGLFIGVVPYNPVCLIVWKLRENMWKCNQGTILEAVKLFPLVAVVVPNIPFYVYMISSHYLSASFDKILLQTCDILFHIQKKILYKNAF